MAITPSPTRVVWPDGSAVAASGRLGARNAIVGAPSGPEGCANGRIPLAAVPGTRQHGWGRAIDLQLDDAALAWMRANAGRYGFHETVPREPWHWEYHPS